MVETNWEAVLHALKARAVTAPAIQITEAGTTQNFFVKQQEHQEEHELGVMVLDCFVTLYRGEVDTGTKFFLGVSRRDKQPPGAEDAEVFEKIRKALGAPEHPLATGLAVHWVWSEEDYA
jgi:hypothetical protein